MPIQMKCEPQDAVPLQNQVPYVQQLQQVVGNGLGCRPQVGISVAQSYPSDVPPVCSSIHSSNPPPVHKEKPLADTDDLTSAENIEDRVDVDSIKGVFGWETLDGVNVPYILRRKKKYVAVRIVERKLLSRYPNSFPDELSKKEPLVSYFVTENEAKLLNEINSIHCSYEYGQQEFTGKDLIVDLSEFEDFYNIVKKTFPENVLAQFRNGTLQQISPRSLQQQPLQSQQPLHSQSLQSQTLQSQPLQSQPLPSPSLPLPEHDKVELAKVCGWVQINNTVSPYIKRFNGKYVPLSVIKYAAGLLTDIQIEGILPTLAECNLLNDTCKIAGFDFNFGQSTKVIHLSEVTQRCKVNILELPFDDPLSHAQYIDIIPSSPPVLLQQEERAVGIPSQPNLTTSDLRLENIQPQAENVPPNVNPNVNPFGRYPPHYPPPAAPSAPPPPPYPYMNLVNMMRQQFTHPGMSNYSALTHGQRLPVMSPEAMQGSGPVPNMSSPPRQHMSLKANHQGSHSSQVKPNTNPYARGSFGPNSAGNSYGPPHPPTSSYGPKPCRSPFGPTSPGSQFVPGQPQQSPGNQTVMYMNRMMSPQLMPNGHAQGPNPYLSQPGPRGPGNNVPRQHFPYNQRFKSPNVSVVPNTSVNTMKMPQRVSASQFSTAPPVAVSQMGGGGQPNLPACSPQFPGSNIMARSPQFSASRVTPAVTENKTVSNCRISPKQVTPAASSAASASLRTPSAGPASDVVKPPESTDKMVSKITGVVLHGKSISCMSVNESDRTGQFCLIEAVCKLYFSQSSMNEFLYALQNVLKIPLYACTDSEEKAFIQYYNLPVSVLKCNKMIKLTDLNSYFPQMLYMFTQTAAESEKGGSDTARLSSGSASNSVVPSDVPDNSEQQTRKRLSSSPMEASGAKQPCRRLEEMVKKLKEGQGTGDEGSLGKRTADIIILDD
ncbi:uncharacterized protein LOC121385138 [Gigantopelta aegis]|uniref:uncharacterized protein LOC121385138 n=1 Tax=Gigantopelta aegis TaxID=1735272 RepID=UPI001B889EE4|nr:uncharacterized protein LOC121385138 [Gigantopelta aegis]